MFPPLTCVSAPPSSCTSSPASLFSLCSVTCWVSTIPEPVFLFPLMLLPVCMFFLLLWPKIKLHPLHSSASPSLLRCDGMQPTTALLKCEHRPLIDFHTQSWHLLCLCSGSADGPDASHKCSFFSLFLEDAPLLSFVASHNSRFFACPKNKKEREKMAAEIVT